MEQQQQQQQQQQYAPPGSYQQQSPYQEQAQQTSSQVLQGDVGLQQFLSRTSMTMVKGVGITAATALAVATTGLASIGLMKVGAFGGIACILGFSFAGGPTYRNGVAVDPALRTGLAATFAVLQGLTIAPLLVIAPQIALPAASLATGIMAGMTAFAMSKPQGSLLRWGPALFTCCFGLLGFGLLSLFIPSMAGVAPLVMTGGGLLLFSAFQAYDTQVAIEMYKQGQPDHLGCAMNFYINFMNLFKNLYYMLMMFQGGD